MIRFSCDDDLLRIQALVCECFGERTKYGVFDNLNGRYLLYFIDDTLVAMTGLNRNTTYPNGSEIDWTCTKPEYRGSGIMHILFSKLIQLTDENIYCSCWKTGDSIHLKSLMKDFGFECICEGHIKSNNLKCGSSHCFDCVKFSDEEGVCVCQEDLYLRKAINN